MFEEVRKYIESEQSQVEFCKDKDYTYHSLKYWIKEYRVFGHEIPVIKKQTSFQEIKLGSTPGSISRKILELTTPSGIHIKIFE